ncbi:peptidoglycan-binding domain-containing protein [Nonomuraea sp. NPDC050680]|uniref:peptidoglycan-binding domain-containing protein n=1 Tax=Nonomuraea sp. NPDC050680 TaxID=3154630 RepID=UPI0033E5705D
MLPSRVYTKGKTYMKGTDVEAWQTLLDELGYDIDVDGLYGPGSADATRKFQYKADVLKTGTVDKTT